MTLRKLATVLPVVAVLALTGQPLTPWPFTFQLPSALLAQLGWHLPSATATPTPTP
jgi:hypothetical protein